ncbi:MAG TPA: hypothetical protein VKT30_13740, partial [Caulobacteraceae bacterium]|nr:hypothetical protein [Caulobacteraceae bacterium]
HAAEQGIAVIQALGEPTEALARDEIYLQNLVAEASRAIEGYASPRVLSALARTQALAARHGGVAEQMQRALGEWAARSSAGDYEAAEGPGDAYVRLARAEGAEGALGLAHMILVTRYRQGDLAGAEAAFESGEPYFHHVDFLRQQGVAGQVYGSAAKVAWLLGRSDEAMRRSDLGCSVSRATGNPYDLVYARHMAAQLYVLRGESAVAEKLAAENIAAAEANGYRSLASLTRITCGRALAALGRAEEGERMLEAALFGTGERRIRASQTLYLSWLAEARAMAGDAARAAAVIEEALAVNPRELYVRPEMLRIRGDFRRTEGDEDGAAADYRAAVDLARSIGAEAWLRRAQSSLAALERTGGRA